MFGAVPSWVGCVAAAATSTQRGRQPALEIRRALNALIEQYSTRTRRQEGCDRRESGKRRALPFRKEGSHTKKRISTDISQKRRVSTSRLPTAKRPHCLCRSACAHCPEWLLLAPNRCRRFAQRGKQAMKRRVLRPAARLQKARHRAMKCVHPSHRDQSDVSQPQSAGERSVPNPTPV